MTDPKILDNFPGPGVGDGSKYPWATWLDGQIRALVFGEHFRIDPADLARAAAKHAKRYGFTVRTRTIRTEDSTVLVLQAVKP